MQHTKRIPQNRTMIKYAVREQMRGRVFVCFLACLLPAVLPWVLRLIPASFGILYVAVEGVPLYGISVPMTLLSFAAAVFVTDPMAVRLAGFFLTLNRDPENLLSPLTVCDCFGPGYLRLVTSMLLRSLVILAWTLVPLCIGALIPGAWEIVETADIRAIQINELGYAFILVAIGVNLQRSLTYAMVPYLLADHPHMTPAEAMRESRAITRGRILELLVMELSFFGWILLTWVTLMIASVYVYPYIEGTMAAYYIAFTEPLPYEKDLHAN